MTSPMPIQAAGLGYAEQMMMENQRRREQALIRAAQEEMLARNEARSYGQQNNSSPMPSMSMFDQFTGGGAAGLGSTTPQMTSAGGGLAQNLGVASVPGGVGNAAGGSAAGGGASGAAAGGGAAGGGLFSGGAAGGGAGGAAGLGAVGFGVGTGLDALARKMGASGTSLQGAGAGAGIGTQYGGPIGGLLGAAIGAGAQQATKTVQDPGDTQLFRDPATGNGLPIVGYMPFPGMTEMLPDWANPSIGDIF